MTIDTTAPTRILLVEDAESFVDALVVGLEREGFDITVARDGIEALERFDADTTDLVLLDLMLPRMSGIDVCRAIRSQSDVPIIMVTAKSTELDTVVGLEVGADDYVAKPYRLRELVSRMRAVLRRVPARAPIPPVHGSHPGPTAPAAQANEENVAADASAESRRAGGRQQAEPRPALDRRVQPIPEEILEVGEVCLDVSRHECIVRATEVKLPLKEFELLEILLANAGRVVTRDALIDRVWGLDYVGDTKTLDVHIKRLRSRIEADPSRPVLITTIRGVGYRFEAPRR
ncbi:MAG TPA: response regulator transcription factor [Acidimicrobiales bacterium]|nr:response regulator transcription factor [Acidimicrobiales bacterium]